MDQIQKILGTNIMSFLLAQHNYKVNKPLVPTLIHDDTTRLIICLAGIVLATFALYKIMRYFHGV